MADKSVILELMNHYFKPIEKLLVMDGVTNIYVNRYDQILYDQLGEKKVSKERWASEEELRNSIETLAHSLKQPIGIEDPLLDAVLPDGSRLNAGIPPIVDCCYLTVRVFPAKQIGSEELIKWRSLTEQMYQFMQLHVLCKQNMIVAGGTSSGKTTLVQMLINDIPESNRLVVIEDTKELKTREYNCIQMEAPKRKNKKGDQVITFGRLVENVLRLTPESLVVGELRNSDAAVPYRTLLNTGHSGIITTFHADSAEESMDRLRDMVQEGMPNTPNEVIMRGLNTSIKVIVHAENTETSGKKVVAVANVVEGKVCRMFEWDYIAKKHICNKDMLALSPIWKKAREFELDLSWMDAIFQPYFLK
jgi:pilus assembly protein CpaF